MLVLTRKINQSIMIGDKIEVKILDVKGDQVKLGIEAPKRIPVHRKEIFEEIMRENIRAAEIVSSEVDKELSELQFLLKKEQRDKKEDKTLKQAENIKKLTGKKSKKTK